MLVLLVWDSSCAIAEINDRLISEVLSSVKICSFSKNTPIGGVWDFKAVTVPTQSTMLRENLETLLVIIRSIFPLVQSSIIRLKASR